MTVSSPVSRIVHVTHEAVTDYTFPFKVFKAGELAVDLVDASFRVLRLELGADYTVSGLGLDQGGTIALTLAGREKAGRGLSLVMLRRMDFTQETDYRPHDVFPAETHERALDILTMIGQELRELVGRAMIAPPNIDKPIQYSDLAALAEAAEAAREAAQAEAARAARAAARAKYGAAWARKWAANPEDEEVRAGLFSARHYAARAAQSAESLNLPDLAEAEAGQALTAVEREGGGLRLEYADIPEPDLRPLRDGLAAKLDKADYSGFPSNTYIDIPWGASGMTYTAPADGWIYAVRDSTVAGQHVAIHLWDASQSVLLMSFSHVTPGYDLPATVIMPMSRGQVAKIYWNVPRTGALRFIPALRAPGL